MLLLHYRLCFLQTDYPILHLYPFTVTDATTLHGMTPQYAAQQILQAIASKQHEVTVASPLHKMAVYLRVLSPSLLDWILRLRANVT